MDSSHNLSVTLRPDQYEPISSRYLNEGRKYEDWALGDVQIDGRDLRTTARMTSTFTSPTDPKGFHLSVFTALEIASQLHIIYAHAWAGLRTKTREGWMIDCSCQPKVPVRDPQQMFIHMQVQNMRRLRENLFCQASYQIRDDAGGLFELSIKAIS